MILLMINPGPYVIKGTIWLALWFYLAGLAALREGPKDWRWVKRARAVWTAGLGLYLVHLCVAFESFYGWSHEAAREVMALETFDRFKIMWGGGIWFYYVFTAVWLAEVIWLWGWPTGWTRRPWWLRGLLHGFLALTFLAGMVVLAEGPVRWFSLTGFMALAGVWLWRKTA